LGEFRLFFFPFPGPADPPPLLILLRLPTTPSDATLGLVPFLRPFLRTEGVGRRFLLFRLVPLLRFFLLPRRRRFLIQAAPPFPVESQADFFRLECFEPSILFSLVASPFEKPHCANDGLTPFLPNMGLPFFLPWNLRGCSLHPFFSLSYGCCSCVLLGGGDRR